MKYIFTLIILLFTFSQGITQEKPVKTYVKWIPTSLLDPFAQSIQFSVEQRFTERYSINYGLGYVTGSNLIVGDENGYRSRIGFRVYKNGLQPSKFSFFHGPTFIARQTFFQNERTICISSDCSTTLNVRYVDMLTRVALTYGYGWHLVSNEHLSLELEVLQGVAYRNPRVLGLPPIATQPGINQIFVQSGSFLFGGDGFRPALHILIKVGFGIRPK